MVESERIAWVDIYKGLAILFVVIGHATGLFNGYIYQFHVAAFFFISGWVSKLDKIDFLEDCYKKFMKLVLPFLTMVIIFGMMTDVMMWFGVDKYFWDEGSILGLKNGVFSFIRNGSTIDLLGASWFVGVLFYASILSHFLYVLSFRRHYIFAVLTLLVYVCGYFAMKNGFIMSYGMDLALIAQGYYGACFLLKRITQEIYFNSVKRKTIFIYVTFAITTIFMWWMHQYLYGAALMDIANRHINSFVWTLVAVVNGVLWLYTLSRMVDILNLKRVKDMLISLGKNTLGVVFFHFTFFRITTLLLVLFGGGRINVGELQRLVPSQQIGNFFWPVYLIIAVMGSVIVWRWFDKVFVLRQALGFDKLFIRNVWNSKLIKNFRYSYCNLTDVVVKIMDRNFNVRDSLILLIIVICLIGCRYVPNLGYHLINGRIEKIDFATSIFVTFPYTGDRVIFGEGWHAQSRDENYRWVRKESVFYARLKNQKRVKISGYIPVGIGAKNVKLFLNNSLVDNQLINGEQQIILQGDISKFIKDGENIFRILLDKEKIPQKDDADKRILSAMFISVEVK